MWIKFANLCRKSDRLDLAAKTLNSLLGQSSPGGNESGQMQAPPHVVYAYFKYTWAKGDRADSLDWLQTFTANLTQDVRPHEAPEQGRAITADPAMSDFTKLLARCHVKIGQWRVALQEGWVANSPDDILDQYRRATQLDPSWYKAWHTWALANFEVISYLEQTRGNSMPIEAFETYIVPAVHGK
jgi:serine/threonine-protein kinase mTOR